MDRTGRALTARLATRVQETWLRYQASGAGPTSLRAFLSTVERRVTSGRRVLPEGVSPSARNRHERSEPSRHRNPYPPAAPAVPDPGLGRPDHLVVPGDVAWKTVVPLGALVLGLVARRSRRWATRTIVAGAVVAAVSVPFVVIGAHDLATGLVLAGMHSTVALAYVVIGTRVLREVAARPA